MWESPHTLPHGSANWKAVKKFLLNSLKLDLLYDDESTSLLRIYLMGQRQIAIELSTCLCFLSSIHDSQSIDSTWMPMIIHFYENISHISYILRDWNFCWTTQPELVSNTLWDHIRLKTVILLCTQLVCLSCIKRTITANLTCLKFPMQSTFTV